MSHSDAELLTSICAQDAHAFEDLSARYRDPLRRHLCGMVREANVAEDLLQEVWLRVWTRADQWEGHGAVKAWLFRIATNLALNAMRDQQRRRETPLELPVNTWATDEEPPVPAWMIDVGATDPQQQIELQERRRRLRQLVDSLPENKREVFRLVHEEEMELGEVAQRLHIPEGTVKSRLYHARRQLARRWQDSTED